MCGLGGNSVEEMSSRDMMIEVREQGNGTRELDGSQEGHTQHHLDHVIYTGTLLNKYLTSENYSYTRQDRQTMCAPPDVGRVIRRSSSLPSTQR